MTGNQLVMVRLPSGNLGIVMENQLVVLVGIHIIYIGAQMMWRVIYSDLVVTKSYKHDKLLIIGRVHDWTCNGIIIEDCWYSDGTRTQVTVTRDQADVYLYREGKWNIPESLLRRVVGD